MRAPKDMEILFSESGSTECFRRLPSGVRLTKLVCLEKINEFIRNKIEWTYVRKRIYNKSGPLVVTEGRERGGWGSNLHDDTQRYRGI